MVKIFSKKYDWYYGHEYYMEIEIDKDSFTTIWYDTEKKIFAIITALTIHANDHK